MVNKRTEKLRTVLTDVLIDMAMEHPDHIHREDCKEYCYVYKLEQALRKDDEECDRENASQKAD